MFYMDNNQIIGSMNTKYVGSEYYKAYKRG